MNNAKKIMKNQGTEKKSKTSAMAMDKTKLLIIAGVIIVVALIGCLLYEQYRPRLALTVNDEKMYLSDMMYDVYTQESQGSQMDSLYKQMGNTDGYWYMEVDEDGTTGAQYSKKQAMDSAKQRLVLYQEAVKAGYELTDEEKKDVETKVKNARDAMTDTQKAIKGLDEKTLTDVLTKQELADRFKQTTIDSFDIDDAAIKKTVSKKDNRQYDLQYFYIKFESTDSDGNTTTMTDTDKATAKTNMEEVLKKAKKADDLSTVIGDDDKTGIQYTTEGLVESNTDFTNADTRKALKKMKNGEFTDVVEVKDDGYYVFYMKDNNSSEAYDSACDNAISEEENSQFTAYYKTLKDSYTIEVNTKQWGRIKMGKTTLDTTTAS